MATNKQGEIIIFPELHSFSESCQHILGLSFHYCSMGPSFWPRGTSLAESHTRQEMFSLADACRITAEAHNRHNFRDTVPNKQANTSVE